MQATLLNFGDCTRVVCDTMNRPLAINIGDVVEADIHDAHFHMIKRAVGTDTLMVVPKETKISGVLQSIIEVLKACETEPYDELVRQYYLIIPPGEEGDMRPHRDTIRRTLSDRARIEVAKALSMTSKVVTHAETKDPKKDDMSDGVLAITIHEQGDEVTRRPVPREIPGDPKTIIVPPSENVPDEVIEPPKPKAPTKKAKAKNGRSKPPIKRERL